MTEINKYPVEPLDDEEDDGTMPSNVAELSSAVVGNRIVRAEKVTTRNFWRSTAPALKLTLGNGKSVYIVDTDDCCAYTDLEAFVFNIDKIEHVITGIGTTDGYTKWHIYADIGDVLEMTVNWSCGNPFYYGYGFEITVIDELKDATVKMKEIEQ